MRRRRGISYILEVVMMTLVITALAGVVLTWGLSQVSSSRVAITSAVNARIDRMQEGIIIEDVQMLGSSTLRVYIRNTGSIQAVVDAAYANNVNAPIAGVCPAGSFQAGQVPVTISTATTTTTTTISYSTTYATTSALTVAVSPIWTVTTTTVGTTTTTITSAAVTTTGTAGTAVFTALINSPHPGGNVNWSTNYTACPSGTNKLSLSINAVGAIDVSVPSSVNTSCAPTPPVCPGTTYTVTASTTRGTTATGSFTV